jgi:hypothetical protein
VVGAQAHRWTYAVFIAALLCGVHHYGSEAPENNVMHLLDRFVPSSARAWLNEDAALMSELLAFLSGEDLASAGAISELVSRAAKDFGSYDLLPHAKVDRPLPAAGGHSTTGAAERTAAIHATAPEPASEYCEDIGKARAQGAEQLRMPECRGAGAPDAARHFMAWLRRELNNGTLRANHAGALVHFVDEGMLLVSPRIFREFAKHFGSDGARDLANASGDTNIGKAIQRQVLRAGWHLRAGKGVNILSYHVIRGDRVGSRLSGVVIPQPARFIDTVPPVNPLLVRSGEERENA